MPLESRNRFRFGSSPTATSMHDESGRRGRAAKRPAAVAAMLLAGSIATSAIAGDTDRFANCVASADMASVAATSRDAGIPSEKAIAIIARQTPEDSVQQIKWTVT